MVVFREEEKGLGETPPNRTGGGLVLDLRVGDRCVFKLCSCSKLFPRVYSLFRGSDRPSKVQLTKGLVQRRPEK